MVDTKFDAHAIRDSAKVLGEIMNDIAAFNELKEHHPNAGTFETAVWLERLVNDRRDAVVAHGERLKKILASLNTALAGIADDLEDTDTNNAKQIKKRMETAETTIGDEVSKLGEDTDEGDGDEGEDVEDVGDDKPGDNGTPGDGYDDPKPSGANPRLN